MNNRINAKRQRATPAQVQTESMPLANDPLYGAAAVGSSADGRASIDHDAILYPRR
jgi:hypothetical protein